MEKESKKHSTARGLKKVKIPQIKTCEQCRLKGKIPVLGSGKTVQPLVFVIGKVPDKVEEVAKIPFIGSNGKFLRKLLYEAGIDPAQCYFTYACKCLPSYNSNPTAEEFKCCRYKLNQELDAIKPHLILAVGDHVCKTLMGTHFSVTKNEGLPFKFNESILVGTIDPGVLMRDPEKASIIAQSFLRMKDWVHTNPFDLWKDPGFKMILQNPEDIFMCIEKLKTYSLWSCDIETDGLARSSEIYSIAFSADDFHFSFPFRKPNGKLFWDTPEIYTRIYTALKELFQTSAVKVFHNAAFDVSVLKSHGIECTNIVDTVLMAYLIDENMRNYKLKPMLWKFLGMGGYDEEYHAHSEDGSAKGVPTDKLLYYNNSDTYGTLLLYHYFNQRMDPKLKKLASKIVMPIQHVLLNATYYGIKVDSSYIVQMIQTYENDIQKLEQDIYTSVGRTFNIQSNDELADVLYSVLGLQVKKLTKKSQEPSTDVEALEELRDAHPVIELLLTYKKKTKLLSTYYRALLNLKDENDTIHTTFFVFGTRTGRLSSADPNLQNIPRGAEVKNVFIARPEKFLIELDFKQIEFRWWAHYCLHGTTLLRPMNGKGLVPISEVVHKTNRLQIASYDWKTKSVVPGQVTQFWRNGKQFVGQLSHDEFTDWLRIEHSGGSLPLLVTPNHEIYLATGEKRAARDLRVGNELLYQEMSAPVSNLRIVTIQKISKVKKGDRYFRTSCSAPGYDLTVQGTHNYFANGILVSNSNDEKMQADIASGMDIHYRVASYVYNKPIDQITKDQRSFAKTVTFGLMYGRGAKAVARAFGLPDEEGQRVKDVFFSLYPKAVQWLNQPKFYARQYGYVENLFGRRRRLPAIRSRDPEIRGKAERQAVNFLPQSTAADYTFFRAIQLAPLLEPYDARLVLTVHDSLIYEAPIIHAEKVLEIIFTTLSTRLAGVDVFFDFDLSIGKRLGSLHECKTEEDLKILYEN